MAGQPLTVVHADYRLDNLLIDGTTVTMIDWQTALRGPAAMDLTCFVVTAFPVRTATGRRGRADRPLPRPAGGRGLVVDRAWFLTSYDQHLLWWMGQFATTWPASSPTTRPSSAPWTR